MLKNFRFIPFCMLTAFQVFFQKIWVYYLLNHHFSKAKKGEKNPVVLKVFKRAYYLSIWYPLVYANTFATLYNHVLKTAEKKAAIYAAAIAVLFDALFDDLDFDLNRLKLMINEPERYVPTTNVEQLMLNLHQLLIKNLPAAQENDFKYYVHAVFDAQTLSLEQKNEPSFEELTTITLQKGGFSSLLFRSLLQQPLKNKADKEAVYYLGGFFQLLNDVTNVPSDIRTKTTTIPTKCSTIKEINNYLNAFRKQAIEKIQELDFTPIESRKKIAFKLHVLSIWGYAHIKKMTYEQRNGITNPPPFQWNIPYMAYGLKLMFFKDYENTNIYAV